MNWDVIQGKWKESKGEIKQKWGKLTDDDLDYVEGSRDRLLGRLQQRYGWKKEAADREVDDYLRSVKTR